MDGFGGNFEWFEKSESHDVAHGSLGNGSGASADNAPRMRAEVAFGICAQ